MPPRYKQIGECRREIIKYARHLDAGTDDGNENARGSGSTKRYKQDMRWFDDWLDDNGFDSVTDVTTPDAAQIAYSLSEQFNGTTPRYRWDRIYAFYEWAVRMEFADVNPMGKWNDSKAEEFNLTKSTKQQSQLKDGEKYAVSQNDVRMIEKNVGYPRIRNQLLIRLLWQSGIRRGEASELTLEMLDRDEREINLKKSTTKNNKRRVVAYQPNLDGLLKKWLDEGYRSECTGGEESEYLFVGDRGAQLSPDAINDVVKKAADNAGLNRRMYADANAPTDENDDPVKNRWKITAHNIRHGLGTYLVNETEMGIYEVSKYLGHASVDITEDIYVEYDPRAGTEDGARYGPE